MRKTTAVLFSCMNGRLAGDHIPWIATGISSAICTRKMTELFNNKTDVDHQWCGFVNEFWEEKLTVDFEQT